MNMDSADADDAMGFDWTFAGLDWSESSISRCTDLLRNGLDLMDVTFLIGQLAGPTDRISANKALLAEVSDVFRAMFFGPLAVDSEVDLSKDERITAESFKSFLRFVYAGEIKLATENILQILHISKKYMCNQLTERCCAFWEAQLEIERSNIFMLLPLVGQYEELDIIFWNFVDANPKAAFSASEFKELCLEDVVKIIGRDSLRVREADVYIAVISWAKTALIREQKTVSRETMRELLGDVFFLIRFTQMDKEEFVEIAYKTETLFLEEKTLFSRHVPAEIAARFESLPRTGSVPEYVSYLKRMRFLSRDLHPNKRVTKHGIDVHLEPDKSVYIGGLPCDMTPEAFAAFVEEYVDLSGVDVWNYMYFPRSQGQTHLSSRVRHGFAFVEFTSADLATCAVESLSGEVFESRALRCDFYRPRGSSKYGNFRRKYSRFRTGTGYKGRNYRLSRYVAYSYLWNRLL